MFISIVAVVVALVGVLVYGFAVNPKLAEVGRILFFVGVLALVLMNAGKVVHL